MLLDCHLGATLKKCLIQISAINWCLRRKMIQQDLETQPFQRKCGSKLDLQKEWMQENTKLMIVQRELVSLSGPYSSEKNCQCWDRYTGYQKQQVYSKSVQKEIVMVRFDQPSYHGQSACTLCLFPASLASAKGVEIHCHILSWASEKRDSTAKHCHRPTAVHSLGMNFCSLPPRDQCSVLNFYLTFKMGSCRFVNGNFRSF